MKISTSHAIVLICTVVSLVGANTHNESWVIFNFSDNALNPANALEGALPNCQPPSTAPESVDAGDWVRGPGLKAAYLGNGFGASGWTNPSGSDPLDRQAAIAHGMYFELSLGPRAGNTLTVQKLSAHLYHPDPSAGRLSHFEWHLSWDGFQSHSIVLQQFTLDETESVVSGQYRLNELNLISLAENAPLYPFERMTLRLYGYDAAAFAGPVSTHTIIGLIQPLESQRGAVEISCLTETTQSWEQHYQEWSELHELHPSVAEPLQDANGDGIANLIAFFSGQNPELCYADWTDGAKMQFIHIDNQWRLKVPRHPNAVGVYTLLEESPDLRSWRPASSARVRHVPGAVIYLFED